MIKLTIGFIQAISELDVQWYKPLAYGYLKSYLTSNLEGVEMRLINGVNNIENVDVLAISSTSQDYGRAIEIAKAAKNTHPRIITVLGGHHVTYLPESMTEDFDIGVMGEGEETFLELCRHLMYNGRNIGDLHAIKGLAFHDNGRVATTGMRDLIVPIDRIPHPIRDYDERPYILTSRGCPYKCTFCSSTAFWNKTRFFSAEYVIEEIEYILERYPGTEHIPIWDDLFIANKQRFARVIELLEDRGITRSVNFAFAVRANLVDDELCEKLFRMNVPTVSFGAESGSNKTLRLIEKNTTVAQNQQAIDTLNRHGQIPICSFIIGAPFETEEDVRMTYEFLLENIAKGKVSPYSAINIMMPMPGTPIWTYALDKGLVDINGFDWNRLTGYASYRSSAFKQFGDWVENRRQVCSVYLAQDTLPQEKLYKIMEFYENIIQSLANKTEENKRLAGTVEQYEKDIQDRDTTIRAMRSGLLWKMTAPIRIIKKKCLG